MEFDSHSTNETGTLSLHCNSKLLCDKAHKMKRQNILEVDKGSFPRLVRNYKSVRENIT